MDMSDVSAIMEVDRAFLRGVASFGVPEPMTLCEWAEKHFYLSAESSYVEGAWKAWPFQRGIMACLSNDDIEEFDLRKSARLGYTKILGAFIGYNAHHRRRNQCIWQPTDDDASEFVKTELDPMLRDVPVLLDVFPSFLRRDKDNTLELKKFIGSMLHIRGGKAAKNYRRISVDVAMLDEIDAFDSNVEKEGSPIKLARKRTEGATFPKLVVGGTPKLKGFSLVEGREAIADVFIRRMIPCPHCGEFHPITFGGKDETHGFKWRDGDPNTVRHLCPHCGARIDQGEFIAAEERGRYQAANGVWMNDDSEFFDAEDKPIPTPKHVAMHVWTAYSPAVGWPAIVREFLDAKAKADAGKMEDLIAFRNTTEGETWAENVETTDADDLRARAEPYHLGTVPRGGLILLCGGDTQDNRIELNVWAIGRGSEMWIVDDHVVWGSPSDPATLAQVEEYLFESEFRNAFGQTMKIEATAIDSAGHHSNDIYEFARKNARRGVRAVHGYSGQEKSIMQGASKVDIDWRGRKVKQGVTLWSVGTNKAKDKIHSRLDVSKPGPGYMHFCEDLSDEWYAQFTGEQRATRRTVRGDESRWTPTRKRVEKWDCCTYVIWLEHHLELGKKPERWWCDREAKFEPAVEDMFTGDQSDSASQPKEIRATMPQQKPVQVPPNRIRPDVSRGNLGSSDWADRL